MNAKDLVNNFFKGMHKDSHPSMQPEGTIPFALNAVNKNKEFDKVGYTNESSTELFCTLSEGFIIRGYALISERESFVVFSYNQQLNQSEIGVVNIPKQTYTILLNDKNLNCKLDFGLNEWIPIEIKRIQDICVKISIYWSNNGIYRKLNIDDNLCSLTCEDLYLIAMDCIPHIEVHSVETGGLGLLSGSYQFCGRLCDDDNNESNVFGLTRPMSLGSDNNIEGEQSEGYFQLKIKGAKTNFTKIRLYVIKKIGGKESAKLITTEPYNINGITYNYRIDPTNSEDLNIEELLIPQTRYLRGKDLVQKNGRLILYNILPEWNFDFQRRANNIKVYPVIYRVPINEAHLYPSMMRNEVYALGIQINYKDGTHSPVFHIPGRKANQNDLERIGKGEPGNCTLCDQPVWKIEDTSSPQWTHPEFVDPYTESDGSVKTYDYTPQDDPYYDPDKEFKIYKDKHTDDTTDIEKDITVAVDFVANFNFPDCLDCQPNVPSGPDNPDGPGECALGFCLDFLDNLNPLELLFWQSIYCINGKWTHLGPCKGCPCTGGKTEDNPDDTNDESKYPACTQLCDPALLNSCPSWCQCQGDNTTSKANGLLDPQNSTGGSSPYYCTTKCTDCDTCPGGECINGICKGKDPIGKPIYCEGCKCSSTGNLSGASLAPLTAEEKLELSTYYTTQYNKFRASRVDTIMYQSPTYVFTCVENEEIKYKGSLKPDYEQIMAENDLNSNNIKKSKEILKTLKMSESISSSTPDSSNCGSSGGCGGGGSGGSAGSGGTVAQANITQGGILDSSLREQPIYSSDLCTVIGYKPIKIQEWIEAFWQSEETYPLTKDCNGDFIYGENAGLPIRHHKMPSTEACPHYVSYQTGVPNIKEFGNEESIKGYAHVMGLKVCNIPELGETPKPVCDVNPITIKYTMIDESNSSVIAKGLVTGTFKGEMYGEAYNVPKNGVNSLELFDRYIERNATTNQDHSGENNIYPAYNFHSPDTEFSKIPLFSRKIKIELELWGKGFRHGLYSLGKDFGGLTTRINQKGTRQAIHLNKMSRPLKQFHENQVVRCLRESSYIKGNSILPKGGKFSLPWLNLFREKSVGIEFEPQQKELRLAHCIDPYLTDGLYNGTIAEPTSNGIQNNCNTNADCEAGFVCVNGQCVSNIAIGVNQTCDASFLGDVFSHEGVIHLGAAHYGTLLRDNPSQYGRLELQQYIDLGLYGTKEDLICGHIEGICGDTYINQYSLKRTSVLTNKVGDTVLKNFDPNYKDLQTKSGGGGLLAPIKKWLVKVLISWGVYDIAFSIIHCGEPPASRDATDPRNGYNNGTPDGSGLRYFMDSGWNGVTPFPGLEIRGRRGYYPQLQKTVITFFVESRINLHYRKVGPDSNQEDLGEVHYKNLKNLQVDSSWNQNTTWEKSWINRFYAELKEVDFWKKIFIFIIVTFVKLVLPFMGIIWLGGYIKPSGDLWGGVWISLGLTILICLIVILVLLAIYAILSYLIDKYLVVLLQIRQCKNDSQGGPGDQFIKGWEDNYTRYNYDHSSVSKLSVNYGMGDPYNTCRCDDAVTNEVIFSNPQLIKSPIDAWRNFKINAYLDIPGEYGPISSIYIVGSTIIVHTLNMPWNVHTGVTELKLDLDSVLLGRPDFMNQATEMYGGMKEGFAGLSDPNSAINTFFGRISPDRKAKKIFVIGQKLDTIPFIGMDQFFVENMPFKLLEQFPDFKIVDEKTPIGIGYSTAYDSKLERYLFTKKDYQAKDPSKLEVVDGYYFRDKKTKNIILFTDDRYFRNVSFTVSYDLEDKYWISFHSYIPDIYMYDRSDLYSVQGNKIYVHNKYKSYQTFYDRYHPFILEVTTRSDSMRAFNVNSISLDTEATKYLFDGTRNIPVRGVQETFNKILFYNSTQATKLSTLINSKSVKESSTELSMNRIMREWRLGQIANYIQDPNSPVIIMDEVNGVFTVLNEKNIGQKKDDYLQDKYVTTRLILDDDKKKDINLIVKTLITKVSLDEE